MKRVYTSLRLLCFALVAIIGMMSEATAQFCGTATNSGSITPTTSWSTTTALSGARRYYTFTAVAGRTYNFSLCSGSGDTYLRLYSGIGGTLLASNDDNGPWCTGLRASLNWTATSTGTYSILLTNFSCNFLTTSQPFQYRYTSGGGGGGSPCASITSLSCGSSSSYTLSGTGAWSSFGGPFTTPGQERIWSFTAPSTVSYNITVTNSEYYVDLFYKVSGSCTSSGWTYVDDILSGSATNTITLTGGVTYWFMLDDENTNTSNGTIRIDCPTPCVGSSVDFSFTAPFSHSSTTIAACNDCSLRGSADRTYAITVTCPGTYTISTCGGASWDTYLYLTTSPCGGFTLASNDDFCGLQSAITYFLSAGTYYVTVEGFSTTSEGAYTLNVTGGDPTGTAGAISGPNVVCVGAPATYSIAAVTGATSYSWTLPAGSTLLSGAGTSTITAIIGSTGTVSVTPSGPCGPGGTSSLAVTRSNPSVTLSSSSFACGYNISCNGAADGSVSATVTGGVGPYSYAWSTGATSSTVTGLGPGSYSVTVTDAAGCAASGSVTLTEPSVVSLSTISSSYACGYGVSCFGALDGSATASVSGGCAPYNYSWSSGASTATATGLGAGTYSVTVSDANGCTVSGSVTITSPTPLLADAGPTAIVYVGYGPSACATLNASASGGCPPYSYSWSTGATTASTLVCPTAPTTYTVTITDANGCSSSDDVYVCTVDVVCGHNNDKVLVCKIPPGNPDNPHTICIAPDAVPAHLATGSYLGPCGSVPTCPLIGPSARPDFSGVIAELGSVFEVFPNPFMGSFSINYSGNSGNASIMIYDAMGRMIQDYTGSIRDNDEGSFTFDASALPGAFYQVVLRENNQIIKSVIVMKH